MPKKSATHRKFMASRRFAQRGSFPQTESRFCESKVSGIEFFSGKSRTVTPKRVPTQKKNTENKLHKTNTSNIPFFNRGIQTLIAIATLLMQISNVKAQGNPQQPSFSFFNSYDNESHFSLLGYGIPTWFFTECNITPSGPLKVIKSLGKPCPDYSSTDSRYAELFTAGSDKNISNITVNCIFDGYKEACEKYRSDEKELWIGLGVFFGILLLGGLLCMLIRRRNHIPDEPRPSYMDMDNKYPNLELVLSWGNEGHSPRLPLPNTINDKDDKYSTPGLTP
jgi:hypothetical protein